MCEGTSFETFDECEISVIIPCYNEQDLVMDVCSSIKQVFSKASEVRVQILLINDGSTDDTLSTIRNLQNGDLDIDYISFSRNFGKEAAIMAGLEYSTGDYIAIMDADGQDPPTLLPQMLSILQTTEYDCVATRRSSRTGEPWIRSACARLFYKLINKMSSVSIVDGARDFRLMTRQMVDAILQLPEYNRFSKGLFQWIGFNTMWLEYKNIPRQRGQTKWSFWKLFLYSLDGIVAFSTAPLALASILGLGISAGSFLLGAYFIVQKLIVGIAVQGYAAMIVSILSIGGIQLFCIGILGQYLAKMFLETKHRPHYIIKETTICEARNVRKKLSN